MTSVIVPPVDLAPGMPSRVVTISGTDLTEGGKSLAGETLTFALSDSLDVTSGGDVIAKTSADVVLDSNGDGSIRLPVYDADVRTWGGQEWAILVKGFGSAKNVRVPAGTTPIALSALPNVRPLRGREVQWAVTGVSVSTTEGAQWAASVSLTGGILDFDFTVPPGGTAWSRGGLNSLSNIDSLYGGGSMGVYRIQNTVIATDLGLPYTSAGVLTVQWVQSVSGNSTMQVWEPWTGGRWTRRFTTVWTAWKQDPVWSRGNIPSNTDLNTLRLVDHEGVWHVPSASVAGTLLNLPTAGAGILTVTATASTSVAMQHYETYGGNGGLYLRQIAVPSSGEWGPWQKVATLDDIPDPGTGTMSSDAGLANALLVQDFTRRHGGARKTGGKGAFAFRCDHGLANFASIVLPLLRARGIVPSIALNSRNWSYAENTGVDAATVDGWVAAGEVEVWNHSATHGNATTVAALTDEIVTGLAELRAQLPSAQIDGWVVPGVSASDPYMGFNNGQTIDQFYGTEAGRLILSHHAVSTGYIAGSHQVVLDGVVRQGGHQFTIDSKTLGEFQAEVDAAIAAGTGLQVMLHPSQLDLTDRITTATLTAMLDYVVAKRDAGELVVLSPYEMVSADSR